MWFAGTVRIVATWTAMIIVKMIIKARITTTSTTLRIVTETRIARTASMWVITTGAIWISTENKVITLTSKNNCNITKYSKNCNSNNAK